MTIEILSFGTLSRIYKELKSNDAKKAVAEYFGLSPKVFASWLENLSYVRNLCAHHSRLWNRTLTKKGIMPRDIMGWSTIPSPKPEKVYNSICIIAYMVTKSNLKSPFYGKLNTLFNRYPQVNLSMAGFPPNWKKDSFWINNFIPLTHKIRIAIFTCRNILKKGKYT